MVELLRHFLLESHARWLIYILVFEYLVAVTLSPTILTDYALAQYFVDKMSFLDAVHVFDDVAKYPEAVSFFIALSFVLLIPKTLSLYYILTKNPILDLNKFIITPYTLTKPTETNLMYRQRQQEGIGGKAVLRKPRSMFSRIFWSLLILFFTISFSALLLYFSFHVGYAVIPERGMDTFSTNVLVWLQFSIGVLTSSSFLIVVSVFIIRDYVRLFIGFSKKFLSSLN